MSLSGPTVPFFTTPLRRWAPLPDGESIHCGRHCVLLHGGTRPLAPTRGGVRRQTAQHPGSASYQEWGSLCGLCGAGPREIPLPCLPVPHYLMGSTVPSSHVVVICHHHCSQLRATPAGKYALRMFAQERGTRVIPCRPLIVPSTPAAKL